MRMVLALSLICLIAACAAPASVVAKPPPLPEFCTRTLGVAQCFANPELLPDHPAGLADGPGELTPEQIADSKKWWPF